jgi:hypothetical protein
MSITLQQGYQTTYKNVVGKMRECIGEGWAGAFAQYHIQGDLYSDLKKGEISYTMSNAGVQSYYMQIDIKDAESNQTQLDAYVSLSAWKKYFDDVQRWAIDESAPCSMPVPRTSSVGGRPGRY